MIQWEDTLAIGDERMDAQHKELLSLLNEFQVKRLVGADKATLHQKLEEVSLFTRYHFCCEESLMTEISFPDLSAHAQRHQVLLEILAHIVRDMDTDKYTAAQIEGFLVQWFMDHLVDEDSKIGRFLVKTRESH